MMNKYLLFLFLILSNSSFSGTIIDDNRLPKYFQDKKDLPDFIMKKKEIPKKTIDFKLSAGTKVFSLYQLNTKATEINLNFSKDVFFPWLFIGSSFFYQQFQKINKTYNFYPFGNVNGRVEDLMGGGIIPQLTVKPVFYGFSPFASVGYRLNYISGVVKLNDAISTLIPDVYKSVNDKTIAMASYGIDYNFGIGYIFDNSFELFYRNEISNQFMKYPDFVVNGQNQVKVAESNWEPFNFKTQFLGLGYTLWF